MLADFEEWSWNQRCSQVKPELEPEVLLNTWNQLTLVWTPIQIGTHLEVQMFVFWFTVWGICMDQQLITQPQKWKGITHSTTESWWRLFWKYFSQKEEATTFFYKM